MVETTERVRADMWQGAVERYTREGGIYPGWTTLPGGMGSSEGTARGGLMDRWKGHLDGSLQDAAPLMLCGPAGIGKGTFARELLEGAVVAAGRGLVLWGRCDCSCQGVYGPFDAMFSTLVVLMRLLPQGEAVRYFPGDCEALTRMFPVFGQIEGVISRQSPRTEMEDPQETRHLACRTLASVLTSVSADVPLVLFVEDAQLLDRDGMHLLRMLSFAIQDAHVWPLFLVDTSDGSRTRSPETSNLLGAMPRETVVEVLEPLTRQEATALLAGEVELRGVEVDDATRGTILAKGGGHPLLLHALLSMEVMRPGRGKFPENLEEALHSLLSMLPSSHLRILQLLGVAGHPLRREYIGRALGLEFSVADEALATLTEHRLIGGDWKLGHGRCVDPPGEPVRDVALQRLDKGARRTFSDALAELLWERPSTRIQAALHGLGGSADKSALDRVSKSAVEVDARFAFHLAVRLEEYVYRLLTTGEDVPADTVRQHSVRLATYLARAGRSKDAADHYLRSIPGAMTAEKIDWQRQAGALLLMAGKVDEGVPLLAELLEGIRVRLPRRGISTILAFLWRRFRLMLRGTGFTEKDESLIPATRLVRLDLFRSIIKGFAVVDHILSSYMNTRWQHLALNEGEPSRILWAFCHELNFVAAAGHSDSKRFQKMLTRTQRLLDRGLHLGHPGYIESAHAYGEYMAGRWVKALGHADHAQRLYEEGRVYYWEKTLMNNVAQWSLFYRGEFGEMGLRTDHALADAMDRGNISAASGNILGLNNVVFLHRHGPAAALREIETFMKLWEAKEYHLQHYWRLLALGHIDFYRGEGTRTYDRFMTEYPRLKRSLLLHLPSVRNHALYLEGHCTLTKAGTARGTERTALIKAAKKVQQRMARGGVPWTRALSGIIRAQMLLLSGRESAAVAGFRGVLHSLDDLDMPLYAGAVRFKLGGILGGDEGRGLNEVAQAAFARQSISDIEAYSRMLVP